MNTRIALLASLILWALVPTAHAGLFDDTEARMRMEEIRRDQESRLTKLEARAEAAARAQLTLNNQIESLRQELAQVRGQIELLSNDLEQSQKRQRDFYVDLDNRLRKIEDRAAQAAAAGTTGQQESSDKPVDPAQETRDYEAAINLLRGGKHAEAAAGFKQFIKNWPKSGFLPGAHFWLAASLMQGRDYAGAKESYAKVAATWPEDSLAPDALLGQAGAEQAQGNAKAARATLQKLVAKYPASEAAGTARQRLGSKKK